MYELAASAMMAEIRSFQNIVLNDCWVSVSSARVFDPNQPTVLIVGSTLEFDGEDRRLASAERLQEVCNHIGASIASSGFNLVNGACPGLPDMVMQSFIGSNPRGLAIGLSAYPSPMEHAVGKPFAPEGFPVTADVTVFCGTGFELLNVLNTLCADVLVVVGGGVGTLLEAATAVEQQIPVLCLGETGGVSAEIEALLRKYVAKFKSYNVETVDTVSDLSARLSEISLEFKASGAHSRVAGLIGEISAATRSFQNCLQIRAKIDPVSIEYRVGETSVLLSDPILMTDRLRLSRVQHKGDEIISALDDIPREYTVESALVRMSPLQNRRLWGPSIDTLILMRALHEQGAVRRGAKALEIGSSSGLLSKWLLGRGAARVVGIERSISAVLCAQWNAHNEMSEGSCEFICADYSSYGIEGSYDLIVCNPPYLPVASAGFDVEGYVSGLDLLRSILANPERDLAEGGSLFLVVSSCSYADARVDELISGMRETGAGRVVFEKSVPLKLPTSRTGSPWIGGLVSGGYLEERPDEDYRFWHKLEVWRIDRR